MNIHPLAHIAKDVVSIGLLDAILAFYLFIFEKDETEIAWHNPTMFTTASLILQNETSIVASRCT